MLINNIWILEQHVICGKIQYFCYAVSILIRVPFLICAMNHAIVDIGNGVLYICSEFSSTKYLISSWIWKWTGAMGY